MVHIPKIFLQIFSDLVINFVLIQEPWQQHRWQSIGGSDATGLHASQRSENLSLSLSPLPSPSSFFVCFSEILYIVTHRWRLLSFYQQFLQETSGFWDSLWVDITAAILIHWFVFLWNLCLVLAFLVSLIHLTIHSNRTYPTERV